jgi:streptomycin 6-kinase
MRNTQKIVLLHGDLHHDNILSLGDGSWVAIDPKGVVGDPAYEVAPFICNPMPELLERIDLALIMTRRLQLFSERLNIPLRRLRDWSYVHAVLAACWSAQENDSVTRWLTVAQIIESL